ncbi:MAG: transcriptional regulator [Anaerolineae bacterium]|nr:transcriptional regulator [Anaerolineae bacterium]
MVLAKTRWTIGFAAAALLAGSLSWSIIKTGYIAINKTFVERKPRTYVAATSAGREAFKEHIAALESILKGK